MIVYPCFNVQYKYTIEMRALSLCLVSLCCGPLALKFVIGEKLLMSDTSVSKDA